LNKFNRLIILGTAAALLLAACDNAVMVNKRVTFKIQGDPHSVLYPLSVTRDGEDVRIQLKENAPLPEIISIDPLAGPEAFNFTRNENTLIVPEKFDHLRLLHAGATPIDILSEATVK